MPSTGDDGALVADFRARSDRERLRLARDMVAAHDPPSRAVLKALLADERVPWVRSALETTLARRGDRMPEAAMSGDIDEVAEIYAQALHAATREVLHEISPLVGRAHLAAREALGPALVGTVLERELLALKRTVEALRRLSAAASVPVPAEFDLSECLENLVAAQREASECALRASGPGPYIVLSDQALVELVIANLLRNAVEATDALLVRDPSSRSIIVNWGPGPGRTGSAS